jgi:hypothetical protein
MAKRGLIVVRAGNAEHAMALSSRDVYLLDGQYFFKNGWQYRKLLGLNFFRGLKSPPLDVPLVTHEQFLFLNDLQTLLDQFETQRDLITLDYSCGFESEKHRSHGGAESGFRVQGGFGAIDLRPAGYCDLTVSDVAPNGQGRVIEIIDMRVRRKFETLEKGMLKVYTKKATVGWFDELAKVISFLEANPVEEVEILHTVV